MHVEIRRLPPGPAARIVGAVAGIIAVLVTSIAWLATLPLPGPITVQGLPIALAIFLVPIGWWLSFYLGTFAVCTLYNLSAKHFGGVVFETVEAPARKSAA